VWGLRFLLACFLLLLPTSILAQAVMQPAKMPSGETPASTAMGTARMVGAILEYTRWPSPRPIIRLCVIGASQHTERLDDIKLSNGATVELAAFVERAIPPPATCDAFYVGHIDAVSMRRLIESARGRPIVTIAEDDPVCRSGAMFCLLFTPRALSFQLSIDAVSRSTVRIDPRVLRLSKGGY
jgi:hypothetical protein